MKKLYLGLFLSAAWGLSAHDGALAIGDAFIEAANASMVDERAMSLAAEFIDLFVDKLDLTKEQLAIVADLLADAKALLTRKTSMSILALQNDFATEIQTLDSLVEEGQNPQELQELFQGAILEIQNNPKYAPLIDLLTDEQSFMKKLSLAVGVLSVEFDDITANTGAIMKLMAFTAKAVERRLR